jgi:adenosine deaminase
VRKLAGMKRSFFNQTASLESMRALPKVLIHEHLDCSLRPARLVELAVQHGVRAVPSQFTQAWQAAAGDQRQETKVGKQYQKWVANYASQSLANYIQAIRDHVLPVMQTEEDLYRITLDRIEDAVADGVVAMELRFAPQLHTANGLTKSAVMEAVIEAKRKSPIPIGLIICSMRHENGRVARQLADLCIKYREHVAKFDLAGDEVAHPGILKWWLKQALRARAEAGIEPTIHLWETNEPTDADVETLDKHDIRVLGHGFRGNRQGNRVCTVCVTSNIVTGQITAAKQHPVDELYNAGKLVTIDTDGTLFTMTDCTKEYVLLNRTFGWGAEHFLRCNLTALAYTSFDAATKAKLERRLRDCA